MIDKSRDRKRRVLPLYPALIAAAALGVASAGCGPDLQSGVTGEQTQQLAPMPEDGGTTQPTPPDPDWIGGDMAYETLPDGGVVR